MVFPKGRICVVCGFKVHTIETAIFDHNSGKIAHWHCPWRLVEVFKQKTVA